MTYKAANGTPFNVRLVERGKRYGLNDCLTHEEREPLVEFYDARYDFTKFGQFVSRYYLRTLLEIPDDAGLDLYGSEPAWKVDAATLRTIKHDVALMAD